MNTLARIIFFVFTVLSAITAHAHTDEMLDQLKSPHGGQTRMAGAYHLEIVVSNNSIDLYVTDHAGNVKDVSAAKASATVLDAKAIKKLDFAFVAGNQLRTIQTLSRHENLQLVVQFQAAGESLLQAKFTPFKKVTTPHEHGNDASHDHSHQEADHQHQE